MATSGPASPADDAAGARGPEADTPAPGSAPTAPGAAGVAAAHDPADHSRSAPPPASPRFAFKTPDEFIQQLKAVTYNPKLPPNDPINQQFNQFLGQLDTVPDPQFFLEPTNGLLAKFFESARGGSLKEKFDNALYFILYYGMRQAVVQVYSNRLNFPQRFLKPCIQQLDANSFRLLLGSFDQLTKDISMYPPGEKGFERLPDYFKDFNLVVQQAVREEAEKRVQAEAAHAASRTTLGGTAAGAAPPPPARSAVGAPPPVTPVGDSAGTGGSSGPEGRDGAASAGGEATGSEEDGSAVSGDDDEEHGLSPKGGDHGPAAPGLGAPAGSSDSRGPISEVSSKRESLGGPKEVHSATIGFSGSTLTEKSANALVAAILEARKAVSPAGGGAGGPSASDAPLLANIKSWECFAGGTRMMSCDLLDMPPVERAKMINLLQANPTAITQFTLARPDGSEERTFSYKLAAPSRPGEPAWAARDQFIFDLATASNVETIKTALAIAKELGYTKINLDKVAVDSTRQLVQIPGSGDSTAGSDQWTVQEAWYILAGVEKIRVSGDFADRIENSDDSGDPKPAQIRGAIAKLRVPARGEELDVVAGRGAVPAARSVADSGSGAGGVASPAGRPRSSSAPEPKVTVGNGPTAEDATGPGASATAGSRSTGTPSAPPPSLRSNSDAPSAGGAAPAAPATDGSAHPADGSGSSVPQVPLPRM